MVNSIEETDNNIDISAKGVWDDRVFVLGKEPCKSFMLCLPTAEGAAKALAALGGREATFTDALTLTIRAEALLRLGRFEEAAADCAEALAIAPASCLARLVQAEAAFSERTVNLRVGYLTDCAEDCSFVLAAETRCAHAASLRAEALRDIGFTV
ncbi:hypothetical protein AK812_SmicGene26538 [Symbiodinium microadriaticum]|uniref:Tetratricopeptide repeat protein n=1 Tax=Symbiodinium microadriaticum TaxID=2951 RepID=A0A1Q9D9A8_SYMMI|nr:hypothetical protein AK812_SmicGene26538 [Symbiodinium microadriaticum]